jgi:hypothetical protein
MCHTLNQNQKSRTWHSCLKVTSFPAHALHARLPGNGVILEAEVDAVAFDVALGALRLEAAT